MPIIAIEVNKMKCSNGTDYYVDLVNDKYQTMSLHAFSIIGHANYTAKEYADFIGISVVRKATADNPCPDCKGFGIDAENTILGCSACHGKGTLK
jgi:hypothetical protein